MNCPTEFIQLMHKFLDEEITETEGDKLREHIKKCEECNQHFQELKKSIAFVQSTSHIQGPDEDFTMRIMQNLPKENKTVGIKRWFVSHPILTAASLFLLLMTGSLFSVWNDNNNFSVSKQPNLVVNNDTVIVPEGKVIEGDVTVKNGSLIIEGEIRGNVTIVNGEQVMASAGNVTGEIRVVDEMFEWLWFNIKQTTRDAIHIFDNSEEKSSNK
jgi:anti-sigma factor RsiW